MRWMSPELFYPDESGLKAARPTKQSDCYAFGMVIYEVLSGHAPFVPFPHCVVMRKVIEGEHPLRPNGPEGAYFTDDLWQMLVRCWADQPQSRPCITTVLERLENVSRALKTPSQESDENTAIEEDDWEIASDSSEMVSWFSPRYIVGFLCGILCLSRIQTAFKRSPRASKRRWRDVGTTSRSTALTHVHL